MKYIVTLRANKQKHILSILTDDSLSYLAKGLAAFMFEKQVQLTSVQVDGTDNKADIEAALQELEAAGHLDRQMMEDAIDMDRVEMIAKARGLTLNGLAKAADVNPATLYSLKNGTAQTVGFNIACRIADVLGVTIQELRKEPPENHDYQTSKKKA